MKLYNIDGCGYCAMVRSELAQIGLEYEKIDVSWSHPERKEVYEISGQTTISLSFCVIGNNSFQSLT